MRKWLALLAMGIGVQTHAISYDASSFSTSGAGFSFTSSGTLGFKTVAGWTGLGVNGGYSGAEIDIGEWLQLNFTQPQVLSELTLAFLFDGPEFGDPNEIAILSDGVNTYSLKATGANTATWTGSGLVENLSPATSSGAAVWRITNPFGNAPVSTVRFSPSEQIAGGGQDSDFSLQGFSVPDTGSTLILFGLALGGFAVFTRRFGLRQQDFAVVRSR